MDEKMSFSGKKTLVMGLGLHGGGVGAVEFLVRHGAKVTVTDLRTRKELAPSLAALAKYKNIRYVLGRHREEDFRAADMILKNPGVRRDHPLLAAAERRGTLIMSDVGIFFRLCPGRMIGITGTRGKSTTTYLIWKFLKTKYPRTHYGGNIRRSVLFILPTIKKGDLVVLELSSFQLMDLTHERKSPSVAVLTNIMEDHLNWHKDMREYQNAKRAIFRFQKPEDDLFFNIDDARLRRLTASTPSRLHAIAASVVLGRYRHSDILKNVGMSEMIDRNLGAHHRTSVALAIAVARHFSVPDAAIAKTIGAYKGLPARQELIAAIRGVRFINDTTATIPDAAIAAVTRFRKLAGKNQLILIAGGQDKKLDFRNMAATIRKSVDHLIVLPGTATQKLAQILNKSRTDLRSVHKSESMKTAVEIAWRLAATGDYVVLSPGAASFGLFLNEFDRGAQFADCVRKLQKHKTQRIIPKQSTNIRKHKTQ